MGFGVDIPELGRADLLPRSRQFQDVWKEETRRHKCVYSAPKFELNEGVVQPPKPIWQQKQTKYKHWHQKLRRRWTQAIQLQGPQKAQRSQGGVRSIKPLPRVSADNSADVWSQLVQPKQTRHPDIRRRFVPCFRSKQRDGSSLGDGVQEALEAL